MQGGEAILDDVAGELQEMFIGRGMKDWHGYFVVPSGLTPPPIGGPYNLMLADGRSVAMQIGRMSPGNHRGSILHFEAIGPMG